MKTPEFSDNYRENLRILLRAGYSVSEANSIASEIKRKFDEEKKREFRKAVDDQLKTFDLLM